ncbi:MAG: FmdB family transcriptional regulator [Chloroflexi bacterium]|nr:FmdB family transcriptional regulator [Chloroflexota bacterium]
MPTYTFKCDVCGVTFDKWLSFRDDQSQVRCPNGHTQVHRVYYAPAVVFKGSGFYVTDNRGSNSGSKPAAKTDTQAKESSGASSSSESSSSSTSSSSESKD